MVHKCSLRMAFEAVEFLRDDDRRGPLLFPSILLMTGFERRPDDDVVLSKSLEGFRLATYKKIAHHGLMKSIKKKINLLKADL
ncbi:hypothetical protein AA313_de0200993 [Arthrobotrys entomopaga]|nr:hypothetical protein AA313_de0200993 [Arthrobotrys entomopaga]